MRPRRPLIHIRCGNGPTVSGNFDQLIDLFRWRDVLFSYIFNEDSSLLIRSDLKVDLIMVEQISQFLHVKFSEGDFDSELDVFVGLGDWAEDVLDHSRNDAWLLSNGLADLSLHCVSLSRGCLPISEDSAVESLDNAVDNWSSRILIYFLLIGLGVETLIKTEFERLFGVSCFSIFDLNRLVVQQFVTMQGS